MKQIVKTGLTSKRMIIFIQKANVTSGVGLTGLTSASAGLTWYYYREQDSTTTAVSIVGETVGTWTSGGFVELDSTHMPGFYEIGIPNAVLAGTTWAVMQLQGAASMVPVNIEFELTNFDLEVATQPINVTQWGGTAVSGTAGIPDVDVVQYNHQTAVTDANNLPKVDVEDWHATAVTVNVVGIPKVDVVDWNGAGVAVPNVAGVPKVDVTDWLGTVVTAATAGVPDVNVKNYNNVAAATDINNLPKVDMEDIKGVAVNTAAAQIGANVVQFAGAAAALDANNLPKVDIEDWKGAAALAPTVAGRPMVETVINNDKTGYSLTQAFPTNFSALAITAGGAVTVGTNQDKTNYFLAAGQITVKKNTALAGFTFPMFSTSSGQLQTGLTVIASRSIDGGAVGLTANAVAEVGSGLYKLDLAASDLNGNSITLILTATGSADNTITFVTQP